MPPRSALTSSFSVSDANNEVVCPLRNHDGSACRKRCLGVSPLAHCYSVQPSHLVIVPAADMMQFVVTGSCASVGEAISLHAGAYTQSSPRALYPEAPGDRGELCAHGQHPAFGATATAARPEELQRVVRFVVHIHIVPISTANDNKLTAVTRAPSTVTNMAPAYLGHLTNTVEAHYCQQQAQQQPLPSSTITDPTLTGTRSRYGQSHSTFSRH